MSLGATVTELNRLLGTKFVPGHPANASPLGRSFQGILIHHNKGNSRHRDFELFKLQFLIQHLQRIEKARPELLRRYKRKLRKAGSTDSYFGARFEVNIASSLITKGLEVEAGERPDFAITDSPVAVECTSVRLRTAKAKTTLTYKIGAAVRQKEKLGYASRYTALFIDITNIAHNSRPFDTEPFRAAATTAIGPCPFGAVLLFTYLMNNDLNRLESNYIRVDHPEIAPELGDFLDRHFAITVHLVHDLSIPYEG